MNELGDINSIDFNTFIGKEIGNVTILKELGRGNRGVVFIAFQKSLKRQVAVKVLPKRRSTTDIERQQFRDEAEIIAVLSHPNIISIFEMGEEEEFYFQVMQLIKGKDLNKIINNRMRNPLQEKNLLPIDESITIATQVLDGMGYAHEEEVIHQDMKPANILIEERTNRALISDFGIAKTQQVEQIKMKNVIFGSPLYLSPEQAAGKETDHRTDIYSLGVLLFKMLAGFLPYRKESIKKLILRKIYEPDTFFLSTPSETSPIINLDMENIILKAMHPDPDNRYQDCFQFRDDLIAYTKHHIDSA